MTSTSVPQRECTATVELQAPMLIYTLNLGTYGRECVRPSVCLCTCAKHDSIPAATSPPSPLVTA